MLLLLQTRAVSTPQYFGY